MKRIQVGGHIKGSKLGFALVDDEDFGKLNEYKWCFTAAGYAIRTIRLLNGLYIRQYMHRVIINAPKGIGVDHANRNRLDNRKLNLRLATQSQNMANVGIRFDNKSGYKGVRYYPHCYRGGKTYNRRKPWTASINVNRKTFNLGYFKTREEAAKAYNNAAMKHFGEFAVFNNVAYISES